MPDTELPLTTRIWFAWLCFFRVLFDGAFAAGVWAVKEGAQARLAPAPSPAAPPRVPSPVPTPVPVAAPPTDAALQLLALFQREGRFVDFLEQDVASFPDADVGAAARVVHEGCRKALRAHARIVPVREEEEGARVTLAAGFPAAEVKLSGNVAGSAPYTGVLRHRGWRVVDVTLPAAVNDHDARILAPAEVEL